MFLCKLLPWNIILKYVCVLFGMNYLFQNLKFCSLCVYLLIKNSSVTQISFLELIFAVCVESLIFSKSLKMGFT